MLQLLDFFQISSEYQILKLFMDSINIFSPATVANVACGYDILGFCLDSVGDYMTIRKTNQKVLKISKLEGCNLSLDIHKNVAGISAKALYDDLKPNCGFEIEIFKKIKPGSGIGSSAASAAGSVFGINKLLGSPLNKHDLTNYAMKGEVLASNTEHADNVSPAIFGGFTLVRSTQPLKVLELPVPAELYATILHPHIEIKTAQSRGLLPDKIDLKKVTQQCANIGSLVHGLHTSNYDTIKDALFDYIAEPYRSHLIPYYNEVKQAVLANNAIGCSISGSGPSIFALCKGEKQAIHIKEVMKNTYSKTIHSFDVYVSKINTEGIKIV